jgi:hypothetical protein
MLHPRARSLRYRAAASETIYSVPYLRVAQQSSFGRAQTSGVSPVAAADARCRLARLLFRGRPESMVKTMASHAELGIRSNPYRFPF